jgi:hypothetical protein
MCYINKSYFSALFILKRHNNRRLKMETAKTETGTVLGDVVETAKEPCTHKTCVHGECLDHNPEWEDIGHKFYVPNPDFFGLKKTYWFNFCCGKNMTMVKEMQLQRCKHCGRTANNRTDWSLGLCMCCGKTVDNKSCD